MMNRSYSDLTVVIRSVYERTEELCKALLLEQGVSEETIHVIHETPFSKAMEVSYRIGLEEGRAWTWCLDADVLLYEKAVDEMMSAARQAPEQVFGLSGKLLDKLFGGWRAVGNHLFRTSSLEQMIAHIAEYDTEGIRPETDAKQKLKAVGLEWIKVDNRLGLHDYEQRYTDIARKSYVHARKHLEHAGTFLKHWSEMSIHDPDFRAALIGFSKGLIHYGDLKIDADQFDDLFVEVTDLLGKKPTGRTDFQVQNSADVRRIMEDESNLFDEQHVSSKHYRELFAELKDTILHDVQKLFRTR